MSEFIFKNRSSQEFGPVERLPIIGKNERILTVTDIPDGVPVYSWSGIKSGKVQFALGLRKKTPTVIDDLYEWLNGEGRLILSSDPEKYVNAYVSGAVLPDALSPRLGRATITFVTEPYRYAINNPTEELELKAHPKYPATMKEANIDYTGTESGEAIYKLYGNGETHIWVNHNEFVIEQVHESVTIDLKSKRIKDKDGNVINRFTIGNPLSIMLVKGDNYFETTNNITKVEVTRNTRWK